MTNGIKQAHFEADRFCQWQEQDAITQEKFRKCKQLQKINIIIACIVFFSDSSWDNSVLHNFLHLKFCDVYQKLLCNDEHYKIEQMCFENVNKNALNMMKYYQSQILLFVETIEGFVDESRSRAARACKSIEKLQKDANCVVASNCDVESVFATTKYIARRMTHGKHSTIEGMTRIKINCSTRWYFDLKKNNPKLYQLAIKWIFNTYSQKQLKENYKQTEKNVQRAINDNENKKKQEMLKKKKKKEKKKKKVLSENWIFNVMDLKQELKKLKTKTEKKDKIKKQLRLRKEKNKLKYKFITFSYRKKQKDSKQLLQLFKDCVKIEVEEQKKHEKEQREVRNSKQEIEDESMDEENDNTIVLICYCQKQQGLNEKVVECQARQENQSTKCCKIYHQECLHLSDDEMTPRWICPECMANQVNDNSIEIE